MVNQWNGIPATRVKNLQFVIIVKAKNINKNIRKRKMFVFSNSLYCRRCGGTNLYFPRHRNKYSKSGWTTRSLCRECFNELGHKKRLESGYYTAKETRTMHQDYRRRNHDKIIKWNTDSRRKIKFLRIKPTGLMVLDIIDHEKRK